MRCVWWLPMSSSYDVTMRCDDSGHTSHLMVGFLLEGFSSRLSTCGTHDAVLSGIALQVRAVIASPPLGPQRHTLSHDHADIICSVFQASLCTLTGSGSVSHASMCSTTCTAKFGNA